MSREHITSLSPIEYKKYIKNMVQNTAFQNLDQIKATHTKVQNNYYKNMDKPQEYLTSKLFSNQQCFLIFAMKSKTLRGVKANFKNLYSDNTLCPLCERSIDTQEHIAHCQVLKNCIAGENVINYSHLTGTLEQQSSFIASYEKLLEVRDELLLEASDPVSSLPGLYSGPLHSKARTSRTPATGSKGDN